MSSVGGCRAGRRRGLRGWRQLRSREAASGRLHLRPAYGGRTLSAVSVLSPRFRLSGDTHANVRVAVLVAVVGRVVRHVCSYPWLARRTAAAMEMVVMLAKEMD